jgi:cytochrome o ubiquinol oxidase subunit 2
MSEKTKAIFNKLLYSGIIIILIILMQPLELYLFVKDIDVIFPAGLIALKERNLLLFIQVIMLFLIIPVYIFTFIFSWWYRSDNRKAQYDPHLVDHKVLEFIWWGLPLVLTIIVAYITWIKTYELDPFRPIESDKKAIRIDVVALQWKWLFLYPEEKIGTIHTFYIPENTPIEFHITADAPMNSFWLPKLGGQIYAMPGMRTKLNLIANEKGTFRGSSANLSGKGFSGMTFSTVATDEKGYREWVDKVKKEGKSLDWESYKEIALPSENNPVEYYQVKDDALFHKILMKFMSPMKG